jgi:hypothetical protein
MKLPPCPSASAWIVPLCTPVLDPTTCTEPICEAGMPLNVIWVWGSALAVFGRGNTLTAGGWAAAPAAPARHTNAATNVTAIALLIMLVRCPKTSCNL